MLGVNMECALRAAQGFVLDFPENLGVARKISFMRPICGAGLYRYRPHPTKKSFENEIECDCWQHGWRLARMGAGLAWPRAWDVSAGAAGHRGAMLYAMPRPGPKAPGRSNPLTLQNVHIPDNRDGQGITCPLSALSGRILALDKPGQSWTKHGI